MIFQFHDPGPLIDGDLALILEERFPGDATYNYPVYKFKMTQTGQAEEIGRIDLRISNLHRIVMYGGHIAYKVHPQYRGHHYAARACRLLLPLARSHGLHTLWITCRPDNLASRRTCELAGAEFVEIVDLPEGHILYQRGERQACRYRLEAGSGEQDENSQFARYG